MSSVRIALQVRRKVDAQFKK